MSVAVLLFLVGGAILLAYSRSPTGMLTPLSIFLYSQIFTLAIAYLRLHPAMEDFQPLTWLVYIGSLLSFALGVFVIRLAMSSSGSLESTPKPSEFLESATQYNWTRHTLLSFGALILFLIGVFFEYKAIGTLILLSDKPHYYIGSGFPVKGYLAYLLSSSPMVAMLFAFGMFKNINPHTALRIIYLAMFLVVYIVGFLAMPTRAYAMIPLLFVAYVFNIAYRKLRLAHIVIGLLAIVTIFLAVADAKDQLELEAKSSTIIKAMKLPYWYIANNWWNLDYALNAPSDIERHPTMYGLNSVSGFLRPVPMVGRIYSDPFLDDLFNGSVSKISSLNTIAYQWDLYKDMGISGIIIVPFLWGIFFTWTYQQMLTRKSIAFIAANALFCYWLTMLFFGPFWINPNSILWGSGILFTVWASSFPNKKRI